MLLKNLFQVYIETIFIASILQRSYSGEALLQHVFELANEQNSFVKSEKSHMDLQKLLKQSKSIQHNQRKDNRAFEQIQEREVLSYLEEAQKYLKEMRLVY